MALDTTSQPRPLKAFTGDGKLITSRMGGQLQIWDLNKGIQIGQFQPAGIPSLWLIHDNILSIVTDQGPLFVDMTPQHWIDQLCRINDRDYTSEERALLPPGADTARPCH